MDKAKAYARWKRRIWLADLMLTFFLLGLLLASGAARSYRSWILSRIPGWGTQVAAYVGSLGLGMTVLSFPLDWFRGSWLEHRFGLSTQGFPQWLWEHTKQIFIGGVLSLILVEGLSALLRWTPATWWIWAALLWLGWSLALSRIFPTWLIPLFYRQTPLKNLVLQVRLESLLNRCKTKVRGIFEIDLSRTTRKANAMLCGLGRTRRVLISDTLLSSHPPEEVEIVLAHEVGHHRLHHMGILITVSTLVTLSVCFFIDRVIRSWLAPLSLTGLEDLAALPLLGLCFLAASLLWMPWINGLSRILEHQADRYALDSTRNPQAFVAAMRRLGERNLAEISPPAWVEWLLYDHPSIAKRIAMALIGDSPAGALIGDSPDRGHSTLWGVPGRAVPLTDGRTVPLTDCLFCKIAVKEIPAKIAYEDAELVAFHDINPQAPVHLIIIPKQHIARVSDLTAETGPVIQKMALAANRLAKESKIAEPGYRLVVNCNPGAGQSVYHLHLHLLGGRPFGWPPG